MSGARHRGNLVSPVSIIHSEDCGGTHFGDSPGLRSRRRRGRSLAIAVNLLPEIDHADDVVALRASGRKKGRQNGRI
jgi:hypothetical protein